MATTTKKPIKKTQNRKKAKAGSGGRKVTAIFSWKKMTPLVVLMALIGGYLGYKILAAPTAWTPNHAAVTPSSKVMPIIKEEGLTYWFFDIPSLPALASGKTETLPAYSEIGNLVLNDKSQGAGVYCADVHTFGRPVRVKFSGANVQFASGETKGGYFEIPASTHKDICVTADLSISSIKVAVERDNVRNKPKTHALIYKLFKKSGTTTPPVVPVPSTPTTTSPQPTRNNTGPRHSLTALSTDQFFNTRTCNRQRISGNLEFDASWMKGQTFNLTDCEITGSLKLYITGGGSTLSAAEMPIINMDYVRVNGSIIAFNAMKLTADHSYFGGAQMGLKDVWAPFTTGPAPYVFKNSMFYGPYASQPSHTEALHIGDYGSGYRFTNVAFVQGGGALANSGVTATINFHGHDTVFDGCWFLWEGATPAYFTVYIDGNNVTVKNSNFQKGASDYVYPSSSHKANYTNNKDVDTKQLIIGTGTVQR